MGSERYSLAIILIFALVGAGVLYLMRTTYEEQVVDLRKQLEQARAREAELAKLAEARAVEAAAAQARAAAERAAAERARMERAAAEARARAEKTAQEKAAAERTAEARARAEKFVAEARARAEKERAEREAGPKSALVPSPSAQSLYDQAAALELEGKGPEAVRMYIRAARAGYGKAALRLGEIYDKTIPGVSRDYAESLKWYNAARVLGEDVPMVRR
jgi:flagellar biosynthesis GTPase FlhF